MLTFANMKMKGFRVIAALMFLLAVLQTAGRGFVVVDSQGRRALPGASVFDKNGTVLCVCDAKGRSAQIATGDFPITVRYLGYHEKEISEACDTVFMVENPMDLQEVVVSSRQQKVLHILGYVREYSTLTTYNDTVFLFREKLVDFMLVPSKKTKFKGWSNPRVLKSKSYYRFTNAEGLDSVSSEGNYHFSWSDWIDAIPSPSLPEGLKDTKVGSDTVMGKYQPIEIWNRKDDRVTVNVNVMAAPDSRKWVRNLSMFFNDKLEFEDFRLRYSYDNVVADTINPDNMTGFSFNIESEGRGHEMMRFNRWDESYFVSTYAEVYILDKEYITVKEGRKWSNRKIDLSDIDIPEPADAPDLSRSILALIDRVENIDKDVAKLEFAPDRRLIGKRPRHDNFSFGNRTLNILKNLTGITTIKTRRNMKAEWNKIRNERVHQNQEKALKAQQAAEAEQSAQEQETPTTGQSE